MGLIVTIKTRFLLTIILIKEGNSVTQMYTRHGRSPVSSEHLRQLDCLYNAYNQEGNSEGDISTVTDDDYASKVDTLVDNMVASDDNVFTHDSEGC